MPHYEQQAAELIQLLQEDQAEKRELGAAFFASDDKTAFAEQQAELKLASELRTKRMLEILDEVGEPTLSNLGTEAAQAVSILALHDGQDVLEKVLRIFNDLCIRDKNDCFIRSSHL